MESNNMSLPNSPINMAEPVPTTEIPVPVPVPEESSKEDSVFGEQEVTQEEADFIEKVFFEEDEEIRLRDGKTYRIPPLGLKDARKLMKLLNTIDTGIILSNLLENEEGGDSYDELMDVLVMGLKPYYRHITSEYLSEYVDLVTAKTIIDSMIGLNGLKKLL